MQAMILCAGKASRLVDGGCSTQKCMLEINGVPALEHVLGHLRHYGYQNIFINLHRSPHIPIAYFGYGERCDVRITWSLEPRPLGTAGGVANIYPALDPDEPLLVWYGDNLSTIRLDKMLKVYHTNSGCGTIAIHERTGSLAHSGVVLTQGRRVTAFIEKPIADEHSMGRWVNAGIYIILPSVVDAVVRRLGKPEVDFGYDVFPYMRKQGMALSVYRMHPPEVLNWIDTTQDLECTRRVWEGK